MAEPITIDSVLIAAGQPASATTDYGSASAHSIPDQLAALQYAAAAGEDEQPNAQGGSRSAWNMTRTAKAVPPGAVGRT